MPSIGESLLLTRKDLAGFPEESIKYVLNLQKEKGWRGIRSNRSHLALLSPDGAHRFGLSSSSSGLNYLKRDVNKYYASKEEEEEKPVKEKVATQKVICPRPNCPKTFNSLENLDVHINVDHEGKIKCPDCKKTFDKPHVLGIHRAKEHGYISPTKARRLELKALKKAKEEEEARTEAIDEFVKLGPDEEVEVALNAGIEGAREEGRKLGEGMKELGIVPPDGVKFDPAWMDRASGIVSSPVVDTMLVRNLVPTDDRVSLKDHAKLFTPEEIREKTTALFRTSNFDDMTPEDRAKLNHLDSQEVFDRQFEEPVVEDIKFLDDRDSWTLDLSDIGEFTVDNIIRNMAAAGLNLEIRVWKEAR